MSQLPANARIIDLPAGTTPVGTEPIESVQNGISVSLTVSQLVAGTPAGTVTNTMLATAPALTVKGNPTNATAAVQDVVGTANQVLRVNSAGTSWSWGQVNLASASAITGSLLVVNGGTGIGTYTLGDTIYSDAANSLAKLAGNITATRKFMRQTGSGAVSAAPVWDTIVAADVAGVALTKVDDTNVTLTLGGSPSVALVAAASITAGWTGTLSVARGGIGVGTLTNHGVLLGQGTSAIVATAVMTDGQLLVGQSAADPLPKTLSSDATLAASGALTIANNAVSFAKMQDIATNSLIGRNTAATGDPENILLNATLEMDGAGNLRRAALTSDVTAPAGSNTTTIANSAVTYAKMQNVSATDRLLGRQTAGAGVVEEIICTAAGRALIDDAAASNQRTTLGLGTIATFDETTAAQYQANTAGKALSTDKVWSAADIVGLTDAATIAVDMATGFNFSVTLAGNRTLGNPTNTKNGQVGVFIITQDGTGTRTLAYSGNYKFAGGTAFTLSTAAGAKDLITYFVQSSTLIIMTGILKAIA